MKKNKERWLKLTNAVLSGLLMLLGFSSCEVIGGQTEEYGTPYATYELKGKVTNQAEQTVPGIQIIVQGFVKQGSQDMKYGRPDTSYTDLKGSFIYKKRDVWSDSKLRVIYKDVSLTADAIKYKTDSVDVDMGELSGGKGWYQGMASKDITIKLVQRTMDDPQ